MRCPDCNKFVSFDEPEIEVESCDIYGTSVQGSVRVVLRCADCSTELKEASIEFEEEIEHECPKAPKEGEKGVEVEYEMEEGICPDPTDRFENKDRHGKPITKARYMTHYYGFEGTVKVKCPLCAEVIEVPVSGEESASGFSELV